MIVDGKTAASWGEGNKWFMRFVVQYFLLSLPKMSVTALISKIQKGSINWRAFLCTLYTETPERAFQEPSGNQTGFLEARSGVYVFGVSSVALQEERFCAPRTRKPPNGPSTNLLKTTQGS